MTGSWAEIFSLLKAWRWRELLYKPTDNATLQFLRYIIVGGCAFVTDFCTVWLLKELGLHYLVVGCTFLSRKVRTLFISLIW